MSEKLGQDPAFPSSDVDLLTGIIKQNKNPEGIPKRFYAACAAMQGLIAANPYYLQGNFDVPVPYHVAKEALAFADELLKQENDE